VKRRQRQSDADRGSVLLAVVVLVALLIPVVAQIVFRSSTESVRCGLRAATAGHRSAARSALAEAVLRLNADPWLLQTGADAGEPTTFEFGINGCAVWCLIEDETAKVDLIGVFKRGRIDGLQDALRSLRPSESADRWVPDLSLWETETPAFDSVAGLECLVASIEGDGDGLYALPERPRCLSGDLTVWGDGSINVNTVSPRVVAWLVRGASDRVRREWTAALSARPYEDGLDFARRSGVSAGARRALPATIVFTPRLVCLNIVSNDGTRRWRGQALLEKRDEDYACVLWREMGYID